MVTWAEASARLGRNDLPYALVTNFWEMGDEDRRVGLHHAWTMPEWPLVHAPRDVWVGMFRTVNDSDLEYLRDDELAPTSELPVTMTLWRGATEDRATGMSWTEDKERAIWFAHRFEHQPVWEIEIHPEYGEVLAHFTQRSESEWVLDLEGWTTDQLERIL